MPAAYFYLFSALAVTGALALVCLRNPVSSAMAMVASFIGLAALFIGLNAYFVGIIQILVYAGAIMVLFLFIIMLLDLKTEVLKSFRPGILAAGIVIPLLFVIQLLGVIPKVPGGERKELDLATAAAHFPKDSEIHKSLKGDPERNDPPSLPDVHLVGLTMFGSKGDNESLATPGYNFPLQIVGVLLLVATVGVVALSLKRKDSSAESPNNQ